jgi:glycosyltransferase involved in cell wall biosynthesis
LVLNPSTLAETPAPCSSGTDRGVTVIIPAYNYARYLEPAVRSAFAQHHRPVEVLIVDDGSTDETPALCQRLQSELPGLLIIRQENAGLSSARNTGIRNATQPLVAFLDADDEWLPAFLDTLVADFSRQPASTPAVACNSFRIDSSGARIGEKNTAPRGDRSFSAADILLKTRFMPSSVVARRSAFDSTGCFDTTLRSSEDRDMWIRLAAAHGPIRYLDQPLVRIRRHGSNMSRNADRMRRAMRQVCRKGFRNRVVPRSRLGFWLRVLSIDHFQGAWMYWDERRIARALLHSMISLALWPFPLDHRDLHEPPFFRLRAAARFLTRAGAPRCTPDTPPVPTSP